MAASPIAFNFAITAKNVGDSETTLAAIDLTGRFEEAAGDALTEALDKFLNDEFPEQ